MATGRSIQLAKQTGEYLVSAELCRRGLISTTFTGNVPEFDILAINEKLQAIPIQVKTITGGTWQFNADTFLDIKKTSNDIQMVKGKRKISNSELICIFVRLRDQNLDEFYIFRKKTLQDIIYNNYTKYLSSKNGKRPKNPKSTHCAIKTDDLKDFRDNWDLIKDNQQLQTPKPPANKFR